MSEKRTMSKVVRTKNNLRPKAVADVTRRNSNTIMDVLAALVSGIAILFVVAVAIAGVSYILLLILGAIG